MSIILGDTLEWLNAVKKPASTKEELLKRSHDAKAWVIEEVDEFIEAVENDDVPEQKNAIVDALWMVGNLAHAAGLSLEDLIEEAKLVRASNFSKFCKTHEEAEESVVKYALGEHPNKLGKQVAAYLKVTGNPEYPYAVFQSHDDKILKSINFVDVQDLK